MMKSQSGVWYPESDIQSPISEFAIQFLSGIIKRGYNRTMTTVIIPIKITKNIA